jgi:hypothetical protein
MTKCDCCHGCSVICDEIYDEIDTTSWCLDFISGFISSTANLWQNLTVRHLCSVIYDEIWKRHVNIVMNHKVFCSASDQSTSSVRSCQNLKHAINQCRSYYMQCSSPRGSYDTTYRSTRSPPSPTTRSATSCGTKMLLEESPSGQSNSAPSTSTSSHEQPSSRRL